MAIYESELTRFMREFLAQHPEEEANRKAGRGAWWDKTPEERVPQLRAFHTPKTGGAEYTFRALPEQQEPQD